MHERHILFLDLEASSLAADSWPIEIGLSRIENGEVLTWSSLIRPRAHWPESAWATKSARVHGIAKSELSSAPDADVVAQEVLRRVSGLILVCNAPDHDARWLARLLEGHVVGEVEVTDFDDAASLRFDGHTLDWVYEGLERRSVPHRAGADSARLARAWLDGVRRSAPT